MILLIPRTSQYTSLNGRISTSGIQNSSSRRKSKKEKRSPLSRFFVLFSFILLRHPFMANTPFFYVFTLIVVEYTFIGPFEFQFLGTLQSMGGSRDLSL
jgi:hypothetical protein